MFVPLMRSLENTRQHLGPTVTPRQLSACLRKTLKSQNIKLITKRSNVVDLDHVTIGGLYDPEDDKSGTCPIEIAIVFNPAQELINTEKLDWHRVSFDVAECIGHELVHQRQHRARNYKEGARFRTTDPEQEYLGSADEIEAYGFTIAAELAEMHGKFCLDSTLDNILMYKVYTTTFDPSHSVVLKLQKQISKYLRQLEVEYNDETNSRRARSRRDGAR